MVSRKVQEGGTRTVILVYHGIVLEVLKETTKYPRYNIRSPYRDLNTRTYEGEV
jgi:hypothetical protein